MVDKPTCLKLGDLRPKLEDIAERQNRTLSGLIKHIIILYLKNYAKTKDK